MTKKLNPKLTSLDDLIQKEYGEIGSNKRDEFEEDFEIFKIGLIKNFEDLIEFEYGKIGSESRLEYEKSAHLFIKNEIIKNAKSSQNQTTKKKN
jgi:hypothetical protein